MEMKPKVGQILRISYVQKQNGVSTNHQHNWKIVKITDRKVYYEKEDGTTGWDFVETVENRLKGIYGPAELIDDTSLTEKEDSQVSNTCKHLNIKTVCIGPVTGSFVFCNDCKKEII